MYISPIRNTVTKKSSVGAYYRKICTKFGAEIRLALLLTYSTVTSIFAIFSEFSILSRVKFRLYIHCIEVVAAIPCYRPSVLGHYSYKLYVLT